MSSNRKHLINELLRVRNLIDPEKNSADVETTGHIEETDNNKKAGDDPANLITVSRTQSIKDKVDNTNYATRDMFSSSDSDDHNSNNASSLTETQIERSSSLQIETNFSYAESPLNQSTLERDNTPFSLNKLARELVVLVEDQVIRRSGEQLDDTFRDELIEAIEIQLHNWMAAD